MCRVDIEPAVRGHVLASTRKLGLGVLALGWTALFAFPAAAVPQFTPSATALMHTTTNGPCVTYFTPGGSGAQVDYNNVSGDLVIDAKIDVLNY